MEEESALGGVCYEMYPRAATSNHALAIRSERGHMRVVGWDAYIEESAKGVDDDMRCLCGTRRSEGDQGRVISSRSVKSTASNATSNAARMHAKPVQD